MDNGYDTYNFTISLYDMHIPVKADIDVVNQSCFYIESTKEDLNYKYDSIKELFLKIRRKDKDGKPRSFDARMVGSRMYSNGEMSLSVEMSDLYIKFQDMAYVAAWLAYKNDMGIIDILDGKVVSHAISNL